MKEVQSINPFTEDVILNHPLLSEKEVDSKISLACEAQILWSKVSEKDRLQCFSELKKVLEKNSEQLARTITLEMGKTFSSAKKEIEKCAFTVGYLSEHFSEWNQKKIIDMSEGKHFVTFKPIGVTLGIMPWNFPVWQAIRFLAPSLALGNAVLLKPASNVFQSSILLEDALKEAGFPEGIYQHLSIDSKGVEYVVKHPLVSGVSLTGSDVAGKKVAEVSGRHMKKMVFELGGSDPYLVMDDADLELAAKKCVESRLLNAGQSCICAKRFLVDHKVKDRFIELFVQEMKAKKFGDPFEESSDFGPLARKDLRDDLQGLVEKAKKNGGKVLCGGEIPKLKGFFYPATAIVDVDPESDIYKQEFFGPVALINGFENLDEAIHLANLTPFGLGAGIFSKDLERASEIAEEMIQSGMVVVNDYIKSDVRLPFGGVKDSGFGRELSPYGIHEFANIKTVSLYP